MCARSLPRGNEVALGGGQRSIRPNPSSCQSVSPLAARCWWLPRVSAPDECPLVGKVAARKTDHRGIVGRRDPNILPCMPPLWNNLTCPVWVIVSNSRSWHQVKWLLCRSGCVQSSNIRDISRRGMKLRYYFCNTCTLLEYFYFMLLYMSTALLCIYSFSV